MTEAQLTEAFARGRIGRRAFVRGMVAAGASLTAAIAMADQIAAAPAGARRSVARFADDVYNEYPPDDVYHHPGNGHAVTTGGVTVRTLPATGSGQQGSAMGAASVAAAGAAAAAVLAMRMRRAAAAESDSE